MKYSNKLASAALLLSLGVAAATTSVVAQNAYPSKAVTFIVPYAAGGNGDVVSRILANGLQAELGQPFVVENRPGAGGNIGGAQVARMAPDGYTIMLATSTATVNQTLYSDAGFDLSTSFDPISMISTAPMVLLVNPELPANDVAEFIALAESEELNYSTGGYGLGGHLFMELFSQEAGVELTHITYPGVAAAVTDLVAGRVDATFSTMASTIELVKDGQLRALAIAAPERSPLLPEVPTLAEAGIENIDAGIWQGIVVPTGTQQAVVDALNTAIVNVLGEEDIMVQFERQGLSSAPSTPDAFGDLIRSEIVRWKAVIEDAGITIQ